MTTLHSFLSVQSYFDVKTPTKPDITLVQKLDYESVTEMEIYIEATVSIYEDLYAFFQSLDNTVL